MIKRITIIFILILIAFMCNSQNLNKFGGYTHLTAETFYNDNLSYSIGLRYKEIKAGYFYQQATIEHENYKFIRKGLFAQVALFNVDKCAYISIGGRLFTSNDKFVGFVPHFEVAYRFFKRYEIPIFLSHYSGTTTGSIGLRILL